MTQEPNNRRDTIRRRLTRNGITITQQGDDVQVIARHNRGAVTFVVSGAATDAVAATICETMGRIGKVSSRDRVAAIRSAFSLEAT